jgi:hypothetical protein
VNLEKLYWIIKNKNKMNKIEIIENNKLISKFMYPEIEPKIHLGEIDDDAHKKIPYYMEFYSDLKYHRSFLWTLPVCIELKNKIQKNKMLKNASMNEWYVSINNAEKESDIDLLYLNLVEGIKWYNNTILKNEKS